ELLERSLTFDQSSDDLKNQDRILFVRLNGFLECTQGPELHVDSWNRHIDADHLASISEHRSYIEHDFLGLIVVTDHSNWKSLFGRFLDGLLDRFSAVAELDLFAADILFAGIGSLCPCRRYNLAGPVLLPVYMLYI